MSYQPETVRTNAEEIESVIRHHFAPWTEMGYELLPPVFEVDDLVPCAVRFTLRSTHAERSIDLTYLPPNPLAGSLDLITCVIWNNAEDRPRGYSLLPVRYFQQHVLGFEVSVFKLETYLGSFREQAEQVIASYELHLREHLIEVVSGQKWFVGYGIEWT